MDGQTDGWRRLHFLTLTLEMWLANIFEFNFKNWLLNKIYCHYQIVTVLQSFDAVGWAAGRAYNP